MTLSNTFVNGTLADADQVNANFSELDKISGTVHYSDAGPYDHTGDPSMALVRTVTIGGISGLGTKLIFITCDIEGSYAGGHYNFQIVKDSQAVNSKVDASTTFTAQTYGSANRFGLMSAIVPVENGSIIYFTAGTPESGAMTVTVKNIKIFCGDANITFTGS